MVELIDTVVRHGGEQVGLVPGADSTRLSLSATPPAAVRGTVHRPGAFHHRLVLEGWELTGPEELPGAWVHQARHALAQLRLRVGGQAHRMPSRGWTWEVSVRHRLRIHGAGPVLSRLSPDLAFTPTEMFLDVSTSGAGSMTVFGTGPVETHSARYRFAVGLGGLVAFEQLESADQVPHWAQGPAREAVALAFDVLAAADRRLIAERDSKGTGATTSPGASGP
jgi:hypothetical protein